MTEFFVQQLIVPIALAILGAAVAWAAAQGARYLKRLRENTDNALIGHAIDLINRLAYPVVTEISQTAVANLKAAREDGKLTKEEAQAALKEAMRTVWSGIGASARKALTDTAGGEREALETYVRPLVESAVASTKGTVPTPAPITDPERRMKETVLARTRLGLDPTP